jgi:hypothetical protein
MRAALSDLKNALDRVRYITIDIDANASAALRDATILARHNTTQCSVTVILTGFFESFLKNAAAALATDICALGRPFVNLPSAIKDAHFREGGNVLMNKTMNKGKFRWVTASREDLARRLQSVNSATPYELVWEAFADTKANPGTEVVTGFLKHFGVLGGWSKVETKSGKSVQTMQTQLESLLLVRNECAHTGTAVAVPSPSEIRDYCELIELLGTAIVEVLEDHLATI